MMTMMIVMNIVNMNKMRIQINKRSLIINRNRKMTEIKIEFKYIIRETISNSTLTNSKESPLMIDSTSTIIN